MTTATTRSLAAIAMLGLGVQSKPASQSVPAVKTGVAPYMFFTQYGADDNEIRACEFGRPLSHMYITQVEPNRCHLVKIPEFSEEKYMMVVTKVNTTEVDEFRDICDPTCTSCTTVMSGALFSSCFETFEGSGLVLEKECIGSPELDEDADSTSITALYYSSSTCAITPDDLHSVLYVRNYPKRQTSGCILDDYAGNQKRYYSLAWEEKEGVTSYTGKFGCTDTDCAVCKHVVADAGENACTEAINDGEGSFKLMAAKRLVHCGTEPEPEMYGCVEGTGYCGVMEGGEYVSDAACKASTTCTEPPPIKYGCASAEEPCGEVAGGAYDSVKECVEGKECRTYGCNVDRCSVMEGGKFATEAECDQSGECKPDDKLYKCAGAPGGWKCEENADGDPEATCMDTCKPDLKLKCSPDLKCVENPDGDPEDSFKCDGDKCVEEPCTAVGASCFPEDICKAACG